MSLYSDKDLNVAAAIKNVLEGKQVQKEEMDPKDHVKEIDGGESFVVVDKDGKAVAKFKERKEADDYAKENHTDLMAGSGDDDKDDDEDVAEVAEPEAQGEKDFKDKHVVKKSGAESDGTIVKEDIDEGIMSEIDQMLQDGKTAAEIAKALKLNLKDVTKIIKTFGEAVEIPKEESDKQKKYQAFFKKALAKFGVKSPSELEKDKRAEFFDYVDANYEADNEED